MLVGKRQFFEEEVPQTFQTYQLRRQMTSTGLESLVAAKKRVTQQNIDMLQSKYPEVDNTEITRLVEDFDNNIEIISDLLDQKQKPQVVIDLNQVDSNNLKQCLEVELIKRLQVAPDMAQAQLLVRQCFQALEASWLEKIKKAEKTEEDNKILKKAFMKQSRRLEQNKNDTQQKETMYQQLLNEKQSELEQVNLINQTLMQHFIKLESEGQLEYTYNNDVC